MKKTISTLLTVIFATTLGLLICLTLSVLIVGAENTEKAIKAILCKSNYIESLKRSIPNAYKNDIDNNTKKTKILGEFYKRDIFDRTDKAPLLVPTDGIAPRSAFLYTGPLSKGGHEGIDIWTNLKGAGIDTSIYKKGNPVYASCDGYVRTVWKENGDVSIICDPIDPIYKDKLPSLKIKTLYGHMADQFSNDVYIYVVEGQRVSKGDLIGHQGNRCFWAPQNIVVHLHFGVYDLSVTPQIPLDPSPYIGISCTTLNQEFKVE